MFRTPRAHNKAHLRFIRGLPCLACRNNIASQAAHVKYDDLRAAKKHPGSAKPHDRWTVPLCQECHALQHSRNERAFWIGRGVDPIFVAMALYLVTGDQEAGEQIIEAWHVDGKRGYNRTETVPTQAQIEAAEDPVDAFLNELEYQKQVKPNATATAALRWAYNEIVRLRALTAAAEAGEQNRILNEAVDRQNIKNAKAATIERCAQVAESWGGERAEGFSKTPEMHTAEAIAAAIRALIKEKK